MWDYYSSLKFKSFFGRVWSSLELSNKARSTIDSVGTMVYGAPEMLEKKDDQDGYLWSKQGDIYSVGVTFNEMFVGMFAIAGNA